jgi:hypothetical protein
MARKLMTEPRLFFLLFAAGVFAACASTARPKGPDVDVYEADGSQAPALRKMPESCRLLGTSGPVDQMESERARDDPYKKERREVEGKGGNVLLVLSQRTVTRPNLECPSGDTSADCLRRAQSWYQVSFEQYACAPEALAELASLPPPSRTGGITILLSSPKKAAQPAAVPTEPRTSAVTPPELKTKVLDMMREKVAPEVILAYVKGQVLSRKVTAEEIIDWTRSGIPDAVIEAAASR